MNPSTNTSVDSQVECTPAEDNRTGVSVEALRRALADNLLYVQGKFPAIATKNDFYMALAYAVREIAEKDRRVGVRVIELIPDVLARVRADEVGDERGLA